MKKIFSFSILAAVICLALLVNLPSIRAQNTVDAIAVWSHDTGTTNQYDVYYSIYDAVADTWWSLGPSPADAIANLSGDDLWPAISFDQNGNAMVVWSHDAGATTGFDIYFSRWYNGAWTTPSPVASVAGDDSDPAVALWWDGTGAVVWVHEGELWYSQWDGNSWTEPASTVTPWPSDLDMWLKMPEIAYDASENSIVVWTDMPARVYHSILLNGTTTWTYPAEISAQPDGAAVQSRKGVSPDRIGNAMVVWNSEPFPPIWDNQYAIWNGIAFSSAAAIYNGSKGLGTAIAFDSLNNAIAVHGTSLAFGDIWYNREAGGTWQPTGLVSTPNYPGVEPRIAFLSNNEAVAVWHGPGPVDDVDIIYRIWDPASITWATIGSIVPAGLAGTDWGPVAIASTSGSPTSPRPLPVDNHDVAVIGVALIDENKTVLCQGCKMRINASVENQGEYTETFDVTLYANTTAIQTVTVTNLAPTVRTTITFAWDATYFAKGNYTVSAYAHPVLGETDIAGNMLIDGVVRVTTLGDIVPDGKVDMKDIGTAAKAFGSYPDHPRWDSKADINDDDKVDMKDIARVAKEFGKIDP